jgi:hypothetical protein
MYANPTEEIPTQGYGQNPKSSFRTSAREFVGECGMLLIRELSFRVAMFGI